MSIHLLACSHISTLDARWNCADYAAPYWRLYYNACEGASVTYADKTIALDSQTVVLISPDTGFTACNKQVVEHTYVHFTWARHKVQPGIYRCHTQGNALVALAQLVALSLRQCPWSADQDTEQHLLLSWVHLALASLSPGEITAITDPHDRHIQQAMRRIEERLPRPVPNTELAHLSGMNERSFIRMFRSRTGETPQAWYLRQRIEHACRMLHHSALSIELIAEKCGFCDRYHFSRAFKQYRGMGPACFRRSAPPAR